jgi:hypothetical protein
MQGRRVEIAPVYLPLYCIELLVHGEAAQPAVSCSRR